MATSIATRKNPKTFLVALKTIGLHRCNICFEAKPVAYQRYNTKICYCLECGDRAIEKGAVVIQPMPPIHKRRKYGTKVGWEKLLLQLISDRPGSTAKQLQAALKEIDPDAPKLAQTRNILVDLRAEGKIGIAIRKTANTYYPEELKGQVKIAFGTTLAPLNRILREIPINEEPSYSLGDIECYQLQLEKLTEEDQNKVIRFYLEQRDRRLSNFLKNQCVAVIPAHWVYRVEAA